ncbi:TonB-dependent siderophore receptor [Herbaspirillum seropedicae]|uniref:TonB-dependent siderophore receptor n=1 Tax=Herbaspirillum seropedicae TaxID=964 RepID=UPI003D96A160
MRQASKAGQWRRTAALLLALSGSVTAQAQATWRSYAIPAGKLEDALARFGQEAGLLLSFRPEQTAGMHSEGLAGQYESEQGLAALLAGTGLQAIRQANGSYLLKPVDTLASAPLPAVTIRAAADTSAYAGAYLARGGTLGVLGNRAVMDIPLATLNYTNELLQDQQARTVADAVLNDASIRMLTSTGGFGETYQIRGYGLTSGDVGVNGLFGLASGNRMPAVMIERVDVLKGPGTLLHGISPEGSIGGSINLVTKRAEDEPLTRLTALYQSRRQPGVQADLGRRFGAQDDWGIRFNTVLRRGEASIAGGRQDAGAGALALDYRGRGWRWSLDAYRQRENSSDFRPQVGFLPGVTALPAPPSGDLDFFSGNQLSFQDDALLTRVEVELSEQLSAYAAVGQRRSATQQNLPTGSVDASGAGSVRNAYYDTASRTLSADAGLRLQAATGAVRHGVSLGVTRLRQQAGNAYLVSADSSAYSLYDPATLPVVSAARTEPRKAYDMTLDSLSLTDTLRLLEDRLQLLVGARRQSVRYDSFDTVSGAQLSSYEASAISPLLGLVVKPVAGLSLYANTTSGLTRGTIVPTGLANAGQVLAPYRSRQLEAGAKLDWGRVMTQAAWFQIDNPSAVITTQASTPASSSYGYDGRQRNRGLELSAYGELMRGLRLLASATFYQARLLRTANGLNDGRTAPGVPQRAANLSLDWEPAGLPGLAFSGRMIHTGPVYYDAANTLRLPSWTRWDLGVRYRSRLGERPVVWRLNVENLFNHSTWLLDKPYVTVAAPRTVLLSMQVDW